MAELTLMLDALASDILYAFQGRDVGTVDLKREVFGEHWLVS